MDITKVKLEEKKDGAWLSAVFADGNQACINVQNKSDSLYKIMVGNNPPKSELVEIEKPATNKRSESLLCPKCGSNHIEIYNDSRVCLNLLCSCTWEK